MFTEWQTSRNFIVDNKAVPVQYPGILPLNIPQRTVPHRITIK